MPGVTRVLTDNAVGTILGYYSQLRQKVVIHPLLMIMFPWRSQQLPATIVTQVVQYLLKASQ